MVEEVTEMSSKVLATMVAVQIYDGGLDLHRMVVVVQIYVGGWSRRLRGYKYDVTAVMATVTGRNLRK